MMNMIQPYAKNISPKDLIYIVGMLIGFGITWGATTTKLHAQGEAIKEFKPAYIRLAVLEAKMDLALIYLERLEKRQEQH